MKTITLTCTLALATLLATSCKKNYKCTCSRTYTTSSGSVTDDNYENYTFKDTRINAESRCNQHNASGSDVFGDYAVNCEID